MAYYRPKASIVPAIMPIREKRTASSNIAGEEVEKKFVYQVAKEEDHRPERSLIRSHSRRYNDMTSCYPLTQSLSTTFPTNAKILAGFAHDSIISLSSAASANAERGTVVYLWQAKKKSARL